MYRTGLLLLVFALVLMADPHAGFAQDTSRKSMQTRQTQIKQQRNKDKTAEQTAEAGKSGNKKEDSAGDLADQNKTSNGSERNADGAVNTTDEQAKQSRQKSDETKQKGQAEKEQLTPLQQEMQKIDRQLYASERYHTMRMAELTLGLQEAEKTKDATKIRKYKSQIAQRTERYNARVKELTDQRVALEARTKNEQPTDQKKDGKSINQSAPAQPAANPKHSAADDRSKIAPDKDKTSSPTQALPADASPDSSPTSRSKAPAERSGR